MIKYHILSLLALAVASITGIESAAGFYESALRGAPWYRSGAGWLMAGVCLASVYLYFRARNFRKKETMKR